jgi:hypothetical protein
MYKKINSIIGRHFGTQMTEEIKLKIYSTTAKVALKFSSEAWVLKKGDDKSQKHHK